MAFRASTKNFLTSASGNLILDKPAGTAEFDTLVLQISNDGLSGNSTYTLPSGFTQLIKFHNSTSDAQSLTIATKIAGASEPSTYTLGCVTSYGSVTAVLSSYSGRHQTAPIGAFQDSKSTSLSASPMTVALVGVNAASGDDLVVMTAIATESASHRWSMTPPTGFTEREDYAPQNWSDTALATKDNVAGGATGTINATATQTVGSANSGWLGVVLALKETAGASAVLNCATGNAVASGNRANLGFALTAVIGNAVAQGYAANVGAQVLLATIGNATADGNRANLDSVLLFRISNAVAGGNRASLDFILNAAIGNAIASGNRVNLDYALALAIGNAVAQGYTASVAAQVLAAAIGNALASANRANLNSVLGAAIGNAIASGNTAVLNSILVAATAGGVADGEWAILDFALYAGVGEAIADGYSFTILQQQFLECGIGSATAQGYLVQFLADTAITSPERTISIVRELRKLVAGVNLSSGIVLEDRTMEIDEDDTRFFSIEAEDRTKQI